MRSQPRRTTAPKGTRHTGPPLSANSRDRRRGIATHRLNSINQLEFDAHRWPPPSEFETSTNIGAYVARTARDLTELLNTERHVPFVFMPRSPEWPVGHRPTKFTRVTRPEIIDPVSQPAPQATEVASGRAVRDLFLLADIEATVRRAQTSLDAALVSLYDQQDCLARAVARTLCLSESAAPSIARAASRDRRFSGHSPSRHPGSAPLSIAPISDISPWRLLVAAYDHQRRQSRRKKHRLARVCRPQVCLSDASTPQPIANTMHYRQRFDDEEPSGSA